MNELVLFVMQHCHSFGSLELFPSPPEGERVAEGRVRGTRLHEATKIPGHNPSTSLGTLGERDLE